MNQKLRQDAGEIIKQSIQAVLPDEAVKRALEGFSCDQGKIYLVAVGKAAWQMANAASECGVCIEKGIVITKYEHSRGSIPHVDCYEAGHPIPDRNGFEATKKVINMVEDLSADDTVLFLLSGGGSALFELPLIEFQELQDITKQFLACGANIQEINTVRKRLSRVKGGRFAEICSPANVFSIVLSDIVGDPLDQIASGPAWPDTTTSDQALRIVEKYGLKLSTNANRCLMQETPKQLDNVKTTVTGSVRELCKAAADACRGLGYKPIVLTDSLSGEARLAGQFMARKLLDNCESKEKLAFIAGGETVVHLIGNGKGGRNQELALAAAEGIKGISDAAVFSVGSDGTDGPTDAAGGYVDGETAKTLERKGIDIKAMLNDNNAYYALKEAGGLIITGPTGTNVNDVVVGLWKPK